MADSDSTKDIENAAKMGDVAENERHFEYQSSMDSNDVEQNTNAGNNFIYLC